MKYIEVARLSSAGAIVADLPDYESLTFDSVSNPSPSMVEISYPLNAGKTAGLGAGAYLSISIDGEEIHERYVIEKLSQVLVTDNGFVGKWIGRSFKALLEDDFVWPSAWPNPTPQGHAFIDATGGTIMKTFLTRSNDRGFITHMDHSSFTGVTDSNGVAWGTIIDRNFSNGQTLLQVAQNLYDAGLMEIRTEGFALKAYKYGTTQRHLSIDTVCFTAGDNISDASLEIDASDFATDVLMEGEGVAKTATSASSYGVLGRRRARYATAGGVPDAGTIQVLADNELAQYTHVQEERGLGISHHEGEPQPFKDYRAGDWVWMDVDGTPIEVQVQQISVQVQKGVVPSVAITIGDLIDSADESLKRRMDAITGGNSGNYGPIPGTTGALPNLAPAAPSAAPTATFASYVDDKGLSRVAGIFQWNPVTTNADGTYADDIASYELYMRTDAAGSKWQLIGKSEATDNPVAYYSPLPEATYLRYIVKTIDRSGVYSVASPEARLFTPKDVTPPKKPTGLVAQSAGTAFSLTWTPVTLSTDETPATDLDHYEVKVTSAGSAAVGVYRTTESKFQFSFEQNVELFGSPRGSIEMAVQALDHVGNSAGYATAVAVSNPPPTLPTNFSGTAEINSLSFTWDAVSEPDLKEYRIYSGTSAASQTVRVWSGIATVATIMSLDFTTDKYFKVLSVDVFGTESSTSNVVGPLRPKSATTVDVNPPAIPTGLAATLTNSADGRSASATVSWTAVTDTENDLAEYIIGYKPSSDSGWQYTKVDYTVTSVVITGLLPYTAYDFRVRASDWSANLSNWSGVLSKSAAANTAPAVPTGLTVNAGMDTLNISWAENTEADMKGGVGVYDVTVATNTTFTTGVLQYRTGATSLAIAGLATDTTYYVRVRATDSSGLSSAYSATVSKKTGVVPLTPLSDGNPPASSPTPVATGGVGYIYASWTPITNNDPVTYEVHLGTSQAFNTSATSKVGEVAGSTIIIKKDGAGADLAYGTTYYVKTVAKDRDGSAAISGYSNAVQLVKVGATDISATPRQLGVPIITTAATAPTSPITGDIWNDTTTGQEKTWSGSAWVATGNVSDKYIGARGTDLVTNGSGMLGSNYNFPSLDFDGSDAPTGANGSFVVRSTVQQSSIISEMIPFDPAKSYKFSFQAKQLVAGQKNTMYGFLAPYDLSNNSIAPQHYMYIAGTTTTLAVDLKPGDTTITLTDATGWFGNPGKNAGSASHLRGVIIWDWVDAAGKKWPVGSYSRHAYLNLWNDGAITGNVITLNAPWPSAYGTVPAGTSMSNSTSGGSFMYMPSCSATIIPETWTGYSDVFNAGIMNPAAQAAPVGGAATWDIGMPPGTAKVKVGWLMNYPSGGTGRHAIAAVSFSDASAAQATADGKNKIVRSISDATGSAGFVDGDLWWKLDANGNVAKQWKFVTGTGWVVETLMDGVLGSLNANKISAGSTFTQDLYVKSKFTLGDATTPGAINSYDYNAANGTGFSLSSTGLDIRSGKVSAKAFDTGEMTAAVITIGTGGIIKTKTGGVSITDSGIVIPSGSLDANILKGNTAFVTTLNIGAGGVIQSLGYTDAGTSGFKLNSGGLVIKGTGNTVDGGTVPDSTLSVNALKASTLTSTVINIGAGGTLNIDSTGQVKSNNYVANSTGYKLSNAGLEINDGTIDAKALKTGSAIIGDITVGQSANANGSMKSFGYVANSKGWKIDKSGIEINEGSISAPALNIQDSDNLVPVQFADFEFSPNYYTVGTSAAMYSGTPPTTVSIETATPRFNGQYLSASWAAAVDFNPYIYFAPTVTTYNIPVEQGEKYIVSVYARATGSVATNLIIAGRLSDGTAFSGGITVTLPASSSVWQRYSSVVTIPAGITGINLYAQSTTRTAGAGFELDGIQVERQMAGATSPSPWTPPATTRMDGGMIRTGEIRSNTNVIVNGSTQPAWSINMSGGAQFGDALIRGSMIVGTTTDSDKSFIASGNYSANSTGWKIDSAGNVEFNSGTIRGSLLIGGTVGPREFSQGDPHNLATVNPFNPGTTNYAGGTDAAFTGSDGELWSVRSPDGGVAGNTQYFMMRPATGPVPFKAGDKIRVVMDGYVETGSTSVTASIWTYSAAGTYVSGGSTTLGTFTTTPQTFEGSITISAGSKNVASYLVGITTANFATMYPRVKNVRFYINAGELTVDGGISAEKIGTGVLQATTSIIAGSPTGAHTELTGTGLNIYSRNTDPEKPQTFDKTISLGVDATDDTLTMTDANGITKIAMDGGTGNATFTGRLSAADDSPEGETGFGDAYGFSFGGTELADRLWGMSQGTVARVYGSDNVSITNITTEYGIHEIQFNSVPGRVYRVSFTGGQFVTTAGTLNAVFRLRYTYNGAAPTISSALARATFASTSAVGQAENIPPLTAIGRWDAGATDPCLIRILITAARYTGTGTIQVKNYAGGGSFSPFEAVVEDMGPYDRSEEQWNPSTGGGVNTGGESTGGTTVTKTSYATTWTANDSETRRGVSGYGNYTVNPTSYTGSTKMLAGQYSSSNGNQFSLIQFTGTATSGSEKGKTISTALSGASVTKVELYVKNVSFYANSGGSQRFSMTALGSLPGSLSGVPGSTYTGNISFTSGQGKWITLPAAAATAIKSSGGRVAMIGPGSSTSNLYYSTWANHAASSGKPLLKITYVK